MAAASRKECGGLHLTGRDEASPAVAAKTRYRVVAMGFPVDRLSDLSCCWIVVIALAWSR
jgi:hypothetical protein